MGRKAKVGSKGPLSSSPSELAAAQVVQERIERIDPKVSELRPKVMGGTATKEEVKEFQERQAAVIEAILAMPVEDLFLIREIKPEMPEKARIFHSVQCAECGEMVAEHRARVRDGKFVCIPCAGEYSRGW